MLANGCNPTDMEEIKNFIENFRSDDILEKHTND